MKSIIKVSCLFWLITNSTISFAQTTTINYLTSSLSTTACNVFSVAFSYPTQPYVITFRYRVNNGCGASQWSPGNSQLIQACGGFNFTTSPNPTNGQMDIALDEETVNNDKAANIQEIQVMDKFNKVVKQFKYGVVNKKTTINISDLKADVYFIKVFNGKEWKAKSIIKQ